MLNQHFLTHESAHWLAVLQQQGLWAMEVFDWHKMTSHQAYQQLDMEQVIQVDGREFTTTRCPIRINGKKIVSQKPAPQLGQHNEKVYRDFIKQ